MPFFEIISIYLYKAESSLQHLILESTTEIFLSGMISQFATLAKSCSSEYEKLWRYRVWKIYQSPMYGVCDELKEPVIITLIVLRYIFFNNAEVRLGLHAQELILGRYYIGSLSVYSNDYLWWNSRQNKTIYCYQFSKQTSMISTSSNINVHTKGILLIVGRRCNTIYAKLFHQFSEHGFRTQTFIPFAYFTTLIHAYAIIYCISSLQIRKRKKCRSLQ